MTRLILRYARSSWTSSWLTWMLSKSVHAHCPCGAVLLSLARPSAGATLFPYTTPFRSNKPDDGSQKSYGHAGLMPSWDRARSAGTPLLKYAWDDARAALADMPDANASPFDDLILEYVNPLNGGPIMPTLTCNLQRIRPGVNTRAHRHTSSTVYVGAEGAGTVVIGDNRFDWARGDVISLPSWCWHAHENRSATDDAILFSVSDAPTLNALNLYREEHAPD